MHSNGGKTQGLAEDIFRPLHEHLIGESPFITELSGLIENLAKSDLTVLITGETGTGKDVVARLLHRRSLRSKHPFVKVNCPALPNELLESELFGYEKGAFTGARTPKPGRFELADKGTIFLDEIAEMSDSVQIKLSQVLDGESFMRIGGQKLVHADTRILAATNVPISTAVNDGRLRKDISFRLSEYVIHMSPLRERREDIPLLAEHFNYNFSKHLEKEYVPLAEHLVSAVQERPWPGNVRELSSRVREYVAKGDEAVLLENRTPGRRQEKAQAAGSAPGRHEAAMSGNGERKFESLKEATRRSVEATERSLIENALKYTLWNRRKAAKLLSISYSSLLRRIDAYSIGRT